MKWVHALPTDASSTLYHAHLVNISLETSVSSLGPGSRPLLVHHRLQLSLENSFKIPLVYIITCQSILQGLSSMSLEFLCGLGSTF